MPSASDGCPPAIEVAGLSVRYDLPLAGRRTVKSMLAGDRHRRGSVTVEALRGIDVAFPQGTASALLGSNGAGKTTLLRVLAGIVPPTEGRVVVRGRVSTVLTLGVGFNVVLTGRENVLLGGLAGGLSARQVAARFDEIEEFAGLGEFIDAPMRTYSSGMYARLAFSVAVALEPDILVIDEALAAGDAAFQERCRARLAELCAQRTTIVLASHSTEQVKTMTEHCVWLDRGRVRMQGPTAEVAREYFLFQSARRDAAAGGEVVHGGDGPPAG